jgi:UDP-GlcNAc:undecaprenyl-phosphate GlcNAc-1-phosphate transferase
MVAYALLFATAVLASAVLSPLLTRVGHRVGLLDLPGGRKPHRAPTPRLGGVAVALAMMLALGVLVVLDARTLAPAIPDPKDLLPIMVGATLVFAVGLWDDIATAAPTAKLLVELLGALIVVGSGITIGGVTIWGQTYELGVLAVPISVVWILVVTNAFNLVDGLDGLAAGLAVIAAVTCTIVLLARGEQAGALLLVSLVGAITGFIAYNLHPARLFLGDSGSLLVGFLLAVTAITGQQKSATTLAVGVPLLIFALPIADTLLTVTRRILSGQRRGPTGTVSPLSGLSEIFRADQLHIHHRLLDLGLSHRGTVLLFHVLAVILSTVALVTMQVP